VIRDLKNLALTAGLALAKSITGSVHELFTGTELVRQGDFTHKIAVTAQDQLGERHGLSGRLERDLGADPPGRRLHLDVVAGGRRARGAAEETTVEIVPARRLAQLALERYEFNRT